MVTKCAAEIFVIISTGKIKNNMGIVYIKKLSENSMLGLWHITETTKDLLKKTDLSLADLEIYKIKKNYSVLL